MEDGSGKISREKDVAACSYMLDIGSIPPGKYARKIISFGVFNPFAAFYIHTEGIEWLEVKISLCYDHDSWLVIIQHKYTII